MKKIILYIALTSLILYTPISCNKNSVIPPEDDQPGRRDYVWTIDTLDMPMNYINSIWGVSPQDVWAVGAGGTANDRLLHYNGLKWTTYNNEPILCTGLTLYGFGAGNIWMGGGEEDDTRRGAGIWHYDGIKWSRNFVYHIDSEVNGIEIYDIWGEQPYDVYACGIIVFNNDTWQGFIIHYNGITWEEIVRGELTTQFLRVRKEQNKLFVLAIKRDQVSADTVVFYELKGTQLSEINSSASWGNFYLMAGDSYFLIDKDIYLYRDGSFVKQLSINDQNFDHYLFGRNGKDIFLNMLDGLAHYNGENIQYVLNCPETQREFTGGLIFDKELFQGFYDWANNKNLILHGSLKE